MTDLPVREPRLRLTSASKRFGNALALDAVDLSIEPGEIHAVVGQNGSGKSTLIKILAGYHVPERGTTLAVDGNPVRLPPRPRDLLAARISFVHQDLGLLDELSVAENVCVGQFRQSRYLRKINWQTQRTETARTLDRLGVDIDPARTVGTLTAAERAMVAIARGVLRQRDSTGIIVLDEATRALPPDSLGEVHALIRRIAESGGSVLLVSHNLEEVMALSDRVTVLRDGTVALSAVRTSSTSEAALAKSMLGSDLQTRAKGAPAPAGEEQFTVRGLTGRTCTDVSFSLRRGEIVGLTGLSGSGYEEVPYLLAGAAPAVAGEVTVGAGTRTLAGSSISALRDFGIALVPERRERDGLAFEMTVADNITLPRLGVRGSRWRVGNSWRRAEAADVIRDLDVRPAKPGLLVKQLSGGNQQKVLLGKWLAGNPSVLVLHEPTQAVDVGARVDIITAIQAAAAAGKAVVIASVDANDLAAVCNRVVVFDEGRVKATLVTDERDDIIDTIYGGRITAGQANSVPSAT